MRLASQKKNKVGRRGFTLVELMVALSIFAIVMVISTGTLLIMIDINAKAQAVYSSATNLSFALDSMTREIRTGDDYYCDAFASGALPATQSPSSGVYIQQNRDCPGDSGIAFIRGKDSYQVAYRWYQSGSISRIEQIVNNPGGASGDSPGWVPITSDDVYIEDFDITVADSEPWLESQSDIAQPYVDILVRGYVNNGLDTNTDFNIQTHIVERLLDLSGI